MKVNFFDFFFLYKYLCSLEKLSSANSPQLHEQDTQCGSNSLATARSMHHFKTDT